MRTMSSRAILRDTGRASRSRGGSIPSCLAARAGAAPPRPGAPRRRAPSRTMPCSAAAASAWTDAMGSKAPARSAARARAAARMMETRRSPARGAILGCLDDACCVGPFGIGLPDARRRRRSSRRSGRGPRAAARPRRAGEGECLLEPGVFAAPDCRLSGEPRRRPAMRKTCDCLLVSYRRLAFREQRCSLSGLKLLNTERRGAQPPQRSIICRT